MKKILLLLIVILSITCTPERMPDDTSATCETSDLGIDTTARYCIYSPPPLAGFNREWQWIEKGDSIILYGFDGLEDTYFDYLFFKKDNDCIKFVKYIQGYFDDQIVFDENDNVIYWGWYHTYLPQENELSLQEYSEDALLIGNIKHERPANTCSIGFDIDFYFEFDPENQITDGALEFIYNH